MSTVVDLGNVMGLQGPKGDTGPKGADGCKILLSKRHNYKELKTLYVDDTIMAGYSMGTSATIGVASWKTVELSMDPVSVAAASDFPSSWTDINLNATVENMSSYFTQCQVHMKVNSFTNVIACASGVSYTAAGPYVSYGSVVIDEYSKLMIRIKGSQTSSGWILDSISVKYAGIVKATIQFTEARFLDN